MFQNFKQCTFEEVKNFLPKESWYYNEGEKNKNISFLLHEGDFSTSKPIDLDEVEQSAIIITGNFSAQNIFNANTDGSCGLVVLGDMSAENILVGGQEIFVRSNLSVSGLYWGDYNHGDLVVKGNFKSQIFISTDYSFNFQEDIEEADIEHLFWEGNDTEEHFYEKLCSLFADEFVNKTEEDWLYVIDKGELLEALEEGKSFLNDKKQQKAKFKKLTQRSLFPDEEISVENVKIIKNNFPLIIDEVSEDWKYGTLWLDKNDNDVVELRHCLSQDDTDFYLFFHFKNRGYSVFITLYSDDNQIIEFSPDGGWDNVEFMYENSHQKEYKAFQKFWKEALKEWTKVVKSRQKFLKEVNKESFEAILQNPKIQKIYNQDKDKDGILHFEEHRFKITPATADSPARISTTYFTDPDEWYHYQWREELGRVVVYFNEEGEAEEFEERSLQHINFYINATRIFGCIEMYFNNYHLYKFKG